VGLRAIPPVRTEPDEELLVALEEMGIEEKALIYDDASDKLSVSEDQIAIRDLHARAFQEWALGNVEGAAAEIFEAVASLVGNR
jgi:serine protease inhibitor